MRGELPHRRLEEQHLALQQDKLEQLERSLAIVNDKIPGREAHIQLLGVKHVVAEAGVQVFIRFLNGTQVEELPRRKPNMNEFDSL